MSSSRSLWIFVGGGACVWGLAACLARAPRPEVGSAGARTRECLAGVSVPFIANVGQTDAAVAFYAPTFAGTVFVTRDGRIVYSLPGKGAGEESRPRGRSQTAALTSAGWSLTEAPIGADGTLRAARSVAQVPGHTQVSYFLGNDPSAWRSGIATYEDVSLGEVWPGVTLSLRSRGPDVEKILTVQPGADPSRIRMRVTGARSLEIDRAGDLTASTGPGDVRLTRPVAYQERGSSRFAVAASYEVQGDSYGFRLAGYDRRLPLVIDPLLQATYLGGSGDEIAQVLAIHPTSGDLYIAGSTGSTNFPGTAGGARPASGGGTDAFVARLTSDLKTLTQATYLGGSGDDLAYALTIDPGSGDVYAGGVTTSTNFPSTAGGAQPAKNGSSDIFVARLTADLKTLTQATYLGGGDHEFVFGLAIQSGSLYATGWTSSSNFPGTAGGMQAVYGGGFFDAFVARLTSDLKTLTQTTYLGTAGDDQAYALALHPVSGDIYVAGYTSSTNFNGGASDAFVARLPADLKTLTRATLLGGSGDERAMGLAIHPTLGDVYVAGWTSSPNFPGTAGGAQAAGGGGNDAFVARLSADLTTLFRATYLGGSGSDLGQTLAIPASGSASGDLYVAGSTTSTNFPGTIGGAQAANGGGTDVFVARLTTDLTALPQATYLGGSGAEGPTDLAIHPITGNVYVAGYTASTNFPDTLGAAQAANRGGNDAFLARLTADLGFAVTPTPTPTRTPTLIPTPTGTPTLPIGSITPTSGSSQGGTAVTITGSGFSSGATVEIGGRPATGVTVPNSARVDAFSPALSPGTLNAVVVTNPGISFGTLANGWLADFLDVPGANPFHPFIETLVRHSITAGCGGGNYCPSSNNTRAQMAVFLLVAANPPGYTPPPCATPVFNDVPCSSGFAPWIDELSARGVTAGCGGGNYCPTDPVTRGQMAVFLLRTKEGNAYTPPACVTPTFADVPCSNGFAKWIDELAARGITAGCGGGNYCPGNSVTRGQMAVFLTTTFGLTL